MNRHLVIFLVDLFLVGLGFALADRIIQRSCEREGIVRLGARTYACQPTHDLNINRAGRS